MQRLLVTDSVRYVVDEPDLLQLFEQAPSFYSSRFKGQASRGDGSATSSKVLLATDRLGVFGVVLYAELDPPRAPSLSHWLGFAGDRQWVSLGGGGSSGRNRLMVREPRQVPNGLYVIPIGGASYSSDEIDRSGRWLTVFSTQLHISSEVARVVISERGAERTLVPEDHGNLIVLHEDGGLPDVRAYDSAGRDLMHGIDQQPGFDEWRRRHPDPG